MKIIFMGTPAFAVPSLEILLKKHTVCAVVTQPDKPKGRGKKMAFSPVKEKALEYGIEVLQPQRVREKDFVQKLKQYEADAIVVVAFGQILPESILNLPKYGCINVHGSLLPKYRGAAPIQWAVMNGEKETGVTTMFMAKGLDSGDMLLKEAIEILPEDTYGTVHDKMSILGADLLEKTLSLLEQQKIIRTVQKEEESTYAPMITKETGHIDWSKNSDEIQNLIRGLDPAPNAYTIYEEEVLKIWKVQKIEQIYETASFGEIVEVTKKGIIVKTADSALLICELQARGGKRMSCDAYMRGHEMKKGVILK